MDLDALLDDTANSVLEPAKPAAPKPSQSTVPAEIKPWLASSANVPKEFRDKWSNYVKLDRNAQVLSKLQPSNSYRSWDSQPLNTSKLLTDLIRKAATSNSCNFDEFKTSKILSLYQPVAETELSKKVQSAYAEKIISELKEEILSDPNYSPEKFPNLAKALSK
jgi:hypothetical protein